MNPVGVGVEHVADTGSTNTDLLQRVHAAAQAGAASFAPCLLVAGRQTAGRGRHGRRWEATAGASLTFSLAWPLPSSCALDGLSLAVGVAIAEALDGEGRIGLKWPNDLWLVEPAARRVPGEGAKLGGVLIETAPFGPGRVAVIGVGLNVRPLAVAEAASGVAWLAGIDPAATPQSVLDQVAAPLVAALRRFEREGFAAFAAGFAQRDLLAGCALRIDTPGGPAGVASGVSATGELLLRSELGMQSVRSGEARLQRQGTPGGVAVTAPAATTC